MGKGSKVGYSAGSVVAPGADGCGLEVWGDETKGGQLPEWGLWVPPRVQREALSVGVVECDIVEMDTNADGTHPRSGERKRRDETRTNPRRMTSPFTPNDFSSSLGTF